MLRNKKTICILFISVIYLATAGHSIQNKHIEYTSHMPTQVFCIGQPIALSYNHWYRCRYSLSVCGVCACSFQHANGQCLPDWLTYCCTSSTVWLLSVSDALAPSCSANSSNNDTSSRCRFAGGWYVFSVAVADVLLSVDGDDGCTCMLHACSISYYHFLNLFCYFST